MFGLSRVETVMTQRSCFHHWQIPRSSARGCTDTHSRWIAGERRWAMPSEPLSRDHLLNDFRFVINDEMGVALNHRECFVSEDVGDFKQ